MAKALLMSDPRETDLRYRALFMTEWDVRLEELNEISRQEDLNGVNTYRVGELFAGLTSAPQSIEGAEYTQYAPQPGKNWVVTTGIYKFAFRASEELRKYGRSNQIATYPKLMVDIIDHTIKVQVYNHYNRAFNSSYPTLYDSTQLISTSHPLANGATASNRLAVDADLNETSLAAGIEVMIRTPNEDGVFMGMAPRVLMTNTAQWDKTIQLTGSSDTTLQGSGESGRAINAVTRAWNIRPHFSPYITDTDAWFLISDKAPVNIVFADRPSLKPVFVDPMTEDWIWRIKGDWVTVLDTWRGVVGSQGA